MCGRFSLGADTDRLVAEFGLAVPEDHGPRYNIAPTQPVTAVVLAPEGLRVGGLRWGLPGPGSGGRTRTPLINARAETADRLPSFADAFRRRRCWILADGFYEWKREVDGSRTPFHMTLPARRPFAFAGIWSRDESAPERVGCAILTTRPAPAVAPVHDRMPVILAPAERDAWLDPSADPAALSRLLRPWEGPLEVTRVGTRVNSVANDDPACLDPLPA